LPWHLQLYRWHSSQNIRMPRWASNAQPFKSGLRTQTQCGIAFHLCIGGFCSRNTNQALGVQVTRKVIKIGGDGMAQHAGRSPSLIRWRSINSR
jgi:hypothetical protein